MDWKVFHEERRCRKERPPPSLQHNTAGLSRTGDQTTAATPAHIHFTSTWPWPFLPAGHHQNKPMASRPPEWRELRQTFGKKRGKKTQKTQTKTKSKENEAFVCDKAAAVFSLEHWFGAGGLEETTVTERVKVTECWRGVQSDSRPDVWTRSGRRLPTSSSCWQLGSFIIRTTLGRSVEHTVEKPSDLSSTQKPSRRNIDLIKKGKYVYWPGPQCLFWL